MALLKESIPHSDHVSSIDTLLSNIDVEGLTASTLQESITKLDTRYIETMKNLMSKSSQTYSTSIDTSSSNATQDLTNEAAFSSALATLQSKNLATDPSTSTIASLASQHAEIATQLTSTLKSISEVSAMADLQQQLISYDTLVSQAQYYEAANIITQLQTAISTIPGMEDSANHVIERVHILQDYLCTIPPQLLIFPPPPDNQQQQHRSSSSSMYIPSLHPPAQQTASMCMQVWKAAEVLGVLDKSMASLSDAVVEKCITPMIAMELAEIAATISNNNSTTITSASNSPSHSTTTNQQQQQSLLLHSPAYSIASSAFSATTTTTATAPHLGLTIERSIYKCLKFIHDSVFHRDNRLIALFGIQFWHAVSDVYIAAKLMPLVPTNDSELDMFTKAGALGIKLEEKATKVGMVSSQEEGPIARFVRQSMSKALGEKRARFASTARDVLAQCNSSAFNNNSKSGGGGGDNEYSRIIVVNDNNNNSSSSGGGGHHVSSMRSLQFDSNTPTTDQQQHHHTDNEENQPTTSTMNTNTTTNNNNIVDAALKELDSTPSPFIPSSSYIITAAIDHLCQLMHSALEEGCRSGSNILVLEMCKAVVDMASLLIAMPSRTSDQEKKVAYFGALRYNECMHVYRTLCMLPQAHAPRLQLLVHRNVNFIAPAERVKRAGEAALSTVLTEQKKELLTLVHDILAWGEEVDDIEVNRREKIVQQVVHSCVRLGTVLYDVLPVHAWVESMSILMNSIAKYLADDIIAQHDIAEEESRVVPHVLQRIYNKDHGIVAVVVKSITVVVVDTQRDSNNSSNNNTTNDDDSSTTITTVVDTTTTTNNNTNNTKQQAQRDTKQQLYSMLMTATTEIHRLQEVCEILDISSKDIARRWVSGRLRAVGLKKDDVIGMIHALFEDTVYRQRSIAMIMQH